MQKIFKLAKEKKFALPAINVSGTNTINAVLETASEINSPVIIQFSKGGAQFIAGNGIDNSNLNASIAGAISGAHHIHNLCDNYKTEVIIHTDHCSRKILPWIDGLLDYGHDFYNKNGYLFLYQHSAICYNFNIFRQYSKLSHKCAHKSLNSPHHKKSK